MSNVEAIKTRALSSTATIDYDNLIASKHANNMPMIDGKPRNDLKEDIEKKGILTKIVLYKGEILDGRNRYSCGKEIGYAFSAKDFETFSGTEEEAEAYVISTNFLRRQLTSAQKNEVIRTMILKYPHETVREIATRCGLQSHSTVHYVKQKMKEPSKEEVRFRDFCTTWDALPDTDRSAFVKEFGRDLCKLMGVQVGQNKIPEART
jgi:hypothetical protein